MTIDEYLEATARQEGPSAYRREQRAAAALLAMEYRSAREQLGLPQLAQLWEERLRIAGWGRPVGTWAICGTLPFPEPGEWWFYFFAERAWHRVEVIDDHVAVTLEDTALYGRPLKPGHNVYGDWQHHWVSHYAKEPSDTLPEDPGLTGPYPTA